MRYDLDLPNTHAFRRGLVVKRALLYRWVVRVADTCVTCAVIRNITTILQSLLIFFLQTTRPVYVTRFQTSGRVFNVVTS